MRTAGYIKITLFIVLFIALLAAARLANPRIWAAKQAFAGRSESEVLTRVDLFGRSFVTADVNALDALLSRDYIHTNTDGSVIEREAWLAWVAEQKPKLDEGTLSYERYENSELRVRVQGDVAWVTGRHDSSGRRDGAAFTTSLRFTQVWVREDGVWRRALFHDSRLPGPE